MKKIKEFVKICKKPQKELKSYLYRKLENYGYSPVAEDGYLLAKGTDVLLTAHMDTVHSQNVSKTYIETIKDFSERVNVSKGYSANYITKYKPIVYDLDDKAEDMMVVSSPQGIGGDDRCGIYMILKILDAGYRPTVLFCEDEEIGGVGSNKFVKTEQAKILSEMKYLIELDRAGFDDAIFYDCGNKEFKQYIKDITGYTEATGSFSDIGHLSPEGDVASVNLSCGYYKAHTTNEYVIFEEMENTIEVVKKLLDDAVNVEKYDYQEEKWSFDYDNYGYDWSYKNWGSSYRYSYTEEYALLYEIDGEEHIAVTEGKNEDEALGYFMFENQDVRICYSDIIDLLPVDEFIEKYGFDPEAIIRAEEDDEDEYLDEWDDYGYTEFEKANDYILNEYQKPQPNVFTKVV